MSLVKIYAILAKGQEKSMERHVQLASVVECWVILTKVQMMMKKMMMMETIKFGYVIHVMELANVIAAMEWDLIIISVKMYPAQHVSRQASVFCAMV